MISLAPTPSADAVVPQRLLPSFFLGGFECSTHLRRAIWLAAAAAVRHDEALKALHQKKMAEGKSYHVALGAVANKLLHIIYAVLRDNKPYYSPSLAHVSVAA